MLRLGPAAIRLRRIRREMRSGGKEGTACGAVIHALVYAHRLLTRNNIICLALPRLAYSWRTQWHTYKVRRESNVTTAPA
jgi:hypothetical protein